MDYTGIILYYSEESEKEPLIQESISGVSICDEEELYVFTSGSANDITIEDGGFAWLRPGGIAQGITIEEGTATSNGGILQLSGSAQASELTVAGYLKAFTGSSVSKVTVKPNGYLTLTNSYATDVLAEDGSTITVYGGTLSNAELESGSTLTVDTDYKSSRSALSDLVLHTGSKVHLGANSDLSGTISLGTALTLSTNSTVGNAELNLLSFELEADGDALYDWSQGAFASLTITVSTTQKNGCYTLLSGISDYTQEISVLLTDNSVLAHCSISTACGFGDKVYSLALEENILSLLVSSCKKVSVSSNLTLKTCDGTYVLHDTELQTEAVQLVLQNDRVGDVVYLVSNGTWEEHYQAYNSHTQTIADITGKNRFDDLVASLGGKSIVMLTDEADAFFADDIYTLLPEGVEFQERLSGVTELRLGDGDDLADMTTLHISDTMDGLTIRGGNGNDILWGSNNGTCLYGDTGDDTLVGGNGNDILAGGSGNDTLQGLGGNDIYAFGSSWGNDSIQLDDSEDFRLWFADGIVLDSVQYFSNNTAVILSGDNSVTLYGVAENGLDGKILIGDQDAALYAGSSYALLEESGAFDANSSLRDFSTIA